jgi:hypothetical protein
MKTAAISTNEQVIRKHTERLKLKIPRSSFRYLPMMIISGTFQRA